MSDEYKYNEIVAAAKANPTEENMKRLGEWFEAYGNCYWNGEEYTVDSNTTLRPVYTEVSEDEYEITGYEFH